jgi:DNA-binding transcriptional MerR regulator
MVMLTIGEFARLGQVSPRMLRHYDEIGLLGPQKVQAETGYRLYGVSQLGDLHRLLALRDLGLTLEQIKRFLTNNPSVEELRGMLRLRQTQIEHTVSEEQGRLRRVEAHLRALEGSSAVDVQDVVIKKTQPIRIAEAVAVAPGFGHENLNPVFAQLMPRIARHLSEQQVTPGMCVAYYDEPADDGTVTLHAGFDLGDQELALGPDIAVVDLPVIEVVSHIHRGAMDSVVEVYEALVRWIEDSGYELAGRSRELYHEWHEDQPERHVTELQLPIVAS